MHTQACTISNAQPSILPQSSGSRSIPHPRTFTKFGTPPFLHPSYFLDVLRRLTLDQTKLTRWPTVAKLKEASHQLPRLAFHQSLPLQFALLLSPPPRSIVCQIFSGIHPKHTGADTLIAPEWEEAYGNTKWPACLDALYDEGYRPAPNIGYNTDQPDTRSETDGSQSFVKTDLDLDTGDEVDLGAPPVDEPETEFSEVDTQMSDPANLDLNSDTDTVKDLVQVTKADAVQGRLVAMEMASQTLASVSHVPHSDPESRCRGCILAPRRMNRTRIRQAPASSAWVGDDLAPRQTGQVLSWGEHPVLITFGCRPRDRITIRSWAMLHGVQVRSKSLRKDAWGKRCPKKATVLHTLPRLDSSRSMMATMGE